METKNRMILSDNILKQLEEMIAKKMKPGEKLPTETQLSKEFSVSRSTIRESMKMLSAKGLIIRKNKGTFVSEQVNQCLVAPLDLLVNMKIGNVKDLIELRQMLELECTRAAAERATDKILKELDYINWKMSEPGLDSQSLQILDIQFHNTIAKATGNVLLVELLNALREVIVRNLEDPEVAMGLLDKSMDTHRQLVEAIKEHDSAKAYEIMYYYFSLNNH